MIWLFHLIQPNTWTLVPSGAKPSVRTAGVTYRRGQVLSFDIADFCRRQRLRQIPSLRGQPDLVLLPSPVNRLFYESPLAVEVPRSRV